MERDLTLHLQNDIVNIRVSAFILKDGKVLMGHTKTNPYYHSIGGRIQFGEDSITAIKREVLEETGYELEVDHLLSIDEIFFTGYDKQKDAKVYEINYSYFMKVPEDFELKNQEEHQELVWVDENTAYPYYPLSFREFIQSKDYSFRHIIDRQDA